MDLIESHKHSQEKKTEFQFREVVIPPRLFFLLRDKYITIVDLLLLVTINSLVTPQKNTQKAAYGCFASNSYLARSAKCSIGYISERLTTLRNMGLIMIININNKRYLETEWSRTAEERSAIPGRYGIAIREEHKRLLTKIKVKETKRETRKKEYNKDKIKINSKCYEWADRLHDLAEKKARKIVRWNRYAWINSFKTILKEYRGDEQRINKALSFLENNTNLSGLPIILHPTHLSKCMMWIEDKMEKLEKQKDKQLPKYKKVIVERDGKVFHKYLEDV